jgi:hypothetical protein
MKQAETLARAGDLKGAEQKYQLAILIRQNGPGQPQDRLRELQAAEAQAAKAKPVPPPQPLVPPQPPSPSQTKPPPQTSNDQAKTKMPPNPAMHGQKQGDDIAVLQLPKSSKAIGRKAEGFSRREAAPGNMQDPANAEDSLTEGIRDFYASQLSHAEDAIKDYLQRGGTHYAGAAHFYLGASLLTQALLTSPKDRPRAQSFRQQARAQFTAAKQLHYKPVESAVSPKVLGEWTQIGNQQ